MEAIASRSIQKYHPSFVERAAPRHAVDRGTPKSECDHPWESAAGDPVAAKTGGTWKAVKLSWDGWRVKVGEEARQARNWGDVESFELLPKTATAELLQVLLV